MEICENLPTLMELRDKALEVAREEALLWTDWSQPHSNDPLIESDELAIPFLHKYYLASSDDREKFVRFNDEKYREKTEKIANNASENSDPWSAAFISWCYVEAYRQRSFDPLLSLRGAARCIRGNELFSASRQHREYVDRALSFRVNGDPVYELVSHTSNAVQAGDWIYASRSGGGGNSHIDIVLDIHSTFHNGNILNWALSAGGNITIDSSRSRRGRTAGFKVYSLDDDFKLTSSHSSDSRPEFFSSSDSTTSETVLENSQISSWRGLSDRTRGLVRLA